MAESQHKSKRKRSVAPTPNTEGADAQWPKKSKTIGAWANLDLILALQNNQLQSSKKIELAFDFISSPHGDQGAIKLPRLASFLADWVQPVLISSQHKDREEDEDHCLDWRCWGILTFCFTNSSSSRVSPNLLRPIFRFSRSISTQRFQEHGRLVESVNECMSLLIRSNTRAFYNAGAELWVSCAADVTILAAEVVSSSEHDEHGSVNTYLSFAGLMLEHLVGFLRSHPNPKNVFPVFVHRLLEPMLEFLVLLHMRVGSGKCENLGVLLKVVENVLSNGLFHPVHITGFLSLRSTSVKQEVRETKGINESYHRHFFRKLQEIITKKKAVALGGFGYLISLFVSSVYHVKEHSLSAKSNLPLKEQAGKPVFEVFILFMEPLVKECKSCVEEFSQPGKISEVKLVEAHCMLKSVNEILCCFIQKRLYERINNTSEGAHFHFLKGLYVAVFSILGKMHPLWLCEFHEDDGRIRKMLPQIYREIFVCIRYFLEIEYKTIDEDLVGLWFMMLSSLAMHISYSDTKPPSIPISAILKLGCQLINIYSEIRQVNNSIFAFCKALRLLVYSDDIDSFCCSISISSQVPYTSYLKSVAEFFHSHEFRHALTNAMKSVPAGQVSGCIQQLTEDITDSLKWIKFTWEMFCGNPLGTAENSQSIVLNMQLQNVLLGRYLSEIYALVLDFVTVSATNCTSIGNSVSNMMERLRSAFSNVVQNHSNNVQELLFSVTGMKFSCLEWPELGCHSCILSDNMSWVSVFFCRLYVSCRSLYQKSITFMPPDQSKKASASMGSFFIVLQGCDWAQSPDINDKGYFSWISAPCITLPDMINSLRESVSQSSESYAPLMYVLHSMALQRLYDLQKLIKNHVFFHEKYKRLTKAHAPENVIQTRLSISKRRKKVIKNLRQEAANIVSFMTGHLALISVGQNMSSNGDDSSYAKKYFSEVENAWDLSVCSLDNSSLPVAIWWLLCRTIDSWSVHAARRNLKYFMSQLFRSLHFSSAFFLKSEGKVLSDQKVTMQQISWELLGNAVFYEQSVLLKHLTAWFCKTIKKSLPSVLSCAHDCNIDFDLLPDWSDISDVVNDKQATLLNGYPTLNASFLLNRSESIYPNPQISEESEKELFSSASMEAETFEALLNVLCHMLKAHFDVKSFNIYATYILNIEKLLVLNLLNFESQRSRCSPYELFRLFLSCRRTLKSLVLESADHNPGSGYPSLFFPVFDNSALIWLLSSVTKVVCLPPDSFGKVHYGDLNDISFALMFHTSCIIFTVSKIELAAETFLIAQKIVSQEREAVCDGNNKHGPLHEDLNSDLSNSLVGWKYMEHIYETLKEETEKLSVDMKPYLCASNPEKAINFLNWKPIASTISSFLGFLQGVSSAMNSIYENFPERAWKSRLKPFFASKLVSCISFLDDFIALCFNVMLINYNQDDIIANPLNLLNLNSTDESWYNNSLSILRQFASFDVSDVSHVYTCKRNMENDCYDNFRSRKPKLWLQSIFSKRYTHGITKVPPLNVTLLQGLLQGESPEVAFALRQLYSVSAAILKVKVLLYPEHNSQRSGDYHSDLDSLNVLVVVCSITLIEMVLMDGKLDSSHFLLLDGIFKYIGALYSYLNLVNPELSSEIYPDLIIMHMRALGKLISLRGMAAMMSPDEANLVSTMLEYQNKSIIRVGQSLCVTTTIDIFKATLKTSLINLINSPLKSHMLIAVELIERELVGVHESCNTVYEITMGNADGGKVSFHVASGIYCFDLLLDSVSGCKHVIKKSLSGLIGAVFNIILHLQSSTIFYMCKPSICGNNASTNPGTAILMCVGILTKVAGGHAYNLEPWHVSQCLHIPTALFHDFRRSQPYVKSCYSPISNNEKSFSQLDEVDFVLDRLFSMDLYAACCRLLCTILRHQKRATECCIAVLEDSVSVLLRSLEAEDADLIQKGNFSWDLQDLVTCASFFRRIYEEIRQQKDTFARHSLHFLSTYICTYAGYGFHKTGIKREVDDALRPGVYSLIDICSPADLQHLHTVLTEGPCRTTLATLQNDYKLNFRYGGKI